MKATNNIFNFWELKGTPNRLQAVDFRDAFLVIQLVDYIDLYIMKDATVVQYLKLEGIFCI